MGNLKDIIDLAKDLESRAKERKDLDTLKQIHALAHEIQSKQVEIMERDLRLMEENSHLKQELSKSNSEDVLIREGIEFRKGPRTGGIWIGFCSSCHLPGGLSTHGKRFICLDEKCGWETNIREPKYNSILKELNP